MIKPDHWIRRWGLEGGVDPFDPSQVNAASYDVRLADDWISPIRELSHFKAAHITLQAGEVILASTVERVKIPRNTACDLKLKSTFGRLWINHSLAGWCDPGFEGNITLELQNIGPLSFTLDAGVRIAQLIFMGMESEPEIAYGEKGSDSHYQGQKGTTRASFDSLRPKRFL